MRESNEYRGNKYPISFRGYRWTSDRESRAGLLLIVPPGLTKQLFDKYLLIRLPQTQA